jgi:hypothetical protein
LERTSAKNLDSAKLILAVAVWTPFVQETNPTNILSILMAYENQRQ